MDYEKKSKEKLERAQKVLLDCTPEERKVVEYIFPELAESEDERMIQYFKDLAPFDKADVLYEKYGFSHKDAIAWLEKQCEQKSADKVEPKFKVGDWVIDKQGIVHQIANVIENVTNHTYAYDIVGGGYFNDNTEGVRLWTIQDAKDGDVLADDNLPFIFKKIDANKYSYAYCGISVYDGFKIETNGIYGEWTWTQDIKPATKEQRNLLFQKMHEAGYEWDAEKLELRKIEQKPVESDDTNAKRMFIKALERVEEQNNKGYKLTDCDKNSWWEDFKTYTSCTVEQKPAWSEEDEYNKRQVCRILREAGCSQKLQDKINSWLESFRFQPHWKPSDEQMEALEHFIVYHNGSTNYAKDLEELRLQLKKIREE